MQAPGGPLAWALLELGCGSLLIALSDRAQAMAGPQEVGQVQEVCHITAKCGCCNFC